VLLDDLFRDAGVAANKKTARAQPAARSPGPVQRHHLRKAIKLARRALERLTAAPTGSRVPAVIYDVGGASCDKDALMRHGGKEYAFMISGRLGVRIGFEEFELGAGDSVSFDAQTPHRLWTVGNEPAWRSGSVVNRHSDSRARTSSA